MWTLEKTVVVSAAHRLPLLEGSPCQRLHGHNWRITVFCRSNELYRGMVVDFSAIKAEAMKLDHACLNDLPGLEHPTAELIATYLQSRIPYCFKVQVEETPGSIVTFEAGA